MFELQCNSDLKSLYFAKAIYLHTCHNKSKNSTDYRTRSKTWNIAILYARRHVDGSLISKTVSLCEKFRRVLHKISITEIARTYIYIYIYILKFHVGRNTISKSTPRNNWFGRILTWEFRARHFARAMHYIVSCRYVRNFTCKLYPKGIGSCANMLVTARKVRDLIKLIIKKKGRERWCLATASPCPMHRARVHLSHDLRTICCL